MKHRLTLNSVSKDFGSSRALSQIDFKISPGEIIALLGDNGAGKSTLIKLISGYHTPSSGTLCWEGVSVENWSPVKARKIGIQTVYQHLGLVDQLSISRNFFLGSEPSSFFKLMNKKKMRSEVARELKKIGISRDLNPDDPVAKLSGGERQAIAISRARYFGAKLLILDEPTSALSLTQTRKVLGYIKEAARQGISVIYITHTLQHLEGLIDRIVVLNKGKKVGDYQSSEITMDQCAQLVTQGYIHQDTENIEKNIKVQDSKSINMTTRKSKERSHETLPLH